MKIPGSIYQDKKGNVYAALYNYWADVYRAAPNKNYETVAHVSYQFGGNSRGIDIFLLKDKLHDISEEIDIKRELTINRYVEQKFTRTTLMFKGKGIEAIDNAYNIRTEIKPNHPLLLHLIRADILNFCRAPAKNPGQNKITLVDRIIPVTPLRIINAEHYLRDGKQEFISSCILDTNLDFSGGCISGFVPGNHASFDGKRFTGYFLDLHAECSYCYAGYQHKSFPKTLVNIDKAHLIEELNNKKKILERDIILRLGKRTECGSKFTRNPLITTLEACVETNTKVVMPTKFLEFDKDVTKLLRKTDSVVLYSTRDDKFERGSVVHGCNNEWRLEQAVKYKEHGVNAILYLLVDLPNEITDRESNILNFANKHNLLVQLLAIRFPGKKVAREIVGGSWEDLTMNPEQLMLESINGKIHGGYKWKSNQLIAQRTHEDYSKLIGENNNCVRLCHHNDITTYCGSCFLKKGFIIPTEPAVKIEYRKRKGRWQTEAMRRLRDRATHQIFKKE